MPLLLAAHVELELPALFSVATHTPQLENAELGDARLQAHGYGRSLVPFPAYGCFERFELTDVVAPGFEQGSHLVVAARCGAQKAKLCRFTAMPAVLRRAQFK